jgi:hypothetical protein
MRHTCSVLILTTVLHKHSQLTDHKKYEATDGNELCTYYQTGTTDKIMSTYKSLQSEL